MESNSLSIYKHNQGLSRGLAVLRSLNGADGAWATIRELSMMTGLHRTTVRRLLETLISEGLVRRSDSDDSYRLTRDVKSLSDGFRDEEWISQIASPVLGELLQKVVWPSDLTTLDDDALVIRETTHRFSPLSFHRKMVRVRLPLLTSAAGRAYLAFCPAAERHQLLDKLARSVDCSLADPAHRKRVERTLDGMRSQGCAHNVGEWATQQHIAAIAVPVFKDDNVAACINIVMLKKAVSIDTAREKYLGSLQSAARKIESVLAGDDGQKSQRIRASG